MNILLKFLTRSGALKGDLDYHVVRASMVLVFLFFGYQKWFAYEAQTLIPFISHGPLIAWMYPAFGVRGASWFLGVSEWLIAALLLAGFWNKKAGMLGAIGGIASMVGTVTIIPFMPDGWAASAGGFPAMTGNVPFLMKDVVLLAVSVYLLKQDALRVTLSAPQVREPARSQPARSSGEGAPAVQDCAKSSRSAVISFIRALLSTCSAAARRFASLLPKRGLPLGTRVATSARGREDAAWMQPGGMTCTSHRK